MGPPLDLRHRDVHHSIKSNGHTTTVNSFPEPPTSTTLYKDPTLNPSNHRPMAMQLGKPVWIPLSVPLKQNSSPTVSSGNLPAKQISTATSTNSVSRDSWPSIWVSRLNSPVTPPRRSTRYSRRRPPQPAITVIRARIILNVQCGGLVLMDRQHWVLGNK